MAHLITWWVQLFQRWAIKEEQEGEEAAEAAAEEARLKEAKEAKKAAEAATEAARLEEEQEARKAVETAESARLKENRKRREKNKDNLFWAAIIGFPPTTTD